MRLFLAFCFGMVMMPALFGQVFYVGTYTQGKSKGIYAYRFDPKNGSLAPLGLMAETPSPSFLAWHPSGKFLYAVNEAGKGSVTAFSVDSATHKLTELNQQPSHGADPCHLAVDHTGKVLIVANYTGGSAASYPIKEDGSLGEAVSVLQHEGHSINPKRQEGPHVHSAYLSADNRFVYLADLGLDRIYRYALDPATAKLTETQPAYFDVKPGFGPRHIAFAPDHKHAYVVNEMGNQVTVFNYDAKSGDMSEFESVGTLPTNFSGESTTAEIQIDSKGRFLYASNRGHDSITVFAVANDGGLKLLQTVPTGGVMPRSFSLDLSGRYLLAANQKGNNMSVFLVDANTGKLTDTGTRAELDSPVCILFELKK